MSDTLEQLINDLYTCYELKTKHVEDYLLLGKQDKSNLCFNSRQKLLNFINSDKMLMSSILKEELQRVRDPYVTGDITNIYNKN